MSEMVPRNQKIHFSKFRGFPAALCCRLPHLLGDRTKRFQDPVVRELWLATQPTNTFYFEKKAIAILQFFAQSIVNIHVDFTFWWHQSNTVLVGVVKKQTNRVGNESNFKRFTV